MIKPKFPGCDQPDSWHQSVYWFIMFLTIDYVNEKLTHFYASVCILNRHI